MLDSRAESSGTERAGCTKLYSRRCLSLARRVQGWALRAAAKSPHTAPLEQSSGASLAGRVTIPQYADSKGEAMALSHSFQVGDRVRMIHKHGDLPKGGSGTIIRVFAAADCSDVQFDRCPGHRLVADSDLAMLERTVESAQA